jgi:hypothetical protein
MDLKRTMVEGVFRDEHGNYLLIVKRVGMPPMRRVFWQFKNAVQEKTMLTMRGAAYDERFKFFRL